MMAMAGHMADLMALALTPAHHCDLLRTAAEPWSAALRRRQRARASGSGALQVGRRGSPRHSAPFVDSTPSTRGSICVAVSSARAKALKRGLDDVVRVAALHLVEVQVHADLIGEREEEVVHQLGVEGADARLLDLQVVDQERPPAEVDDDASPAPRRADRRRRRSGGCRPCRRAPRAAPGRAPGRRPRPCGADRRRDRRAPARVRSKKPWRAKLSSMWLRNGMPVSTVGACRGRRRSSSTVMSVSLVVRVTRARRPLCARVAARSCCGMRRPLCVPS